MIGYVVKQDYAKWDTLSEKLDRISFPLGISELFHLNYITNISEKFAPLFLLLFYCEVPRNFFF
jgi:hypothetical protein